MTTPLRVLMVEDSENDALIIQHALRAGDYEATVLRVETGEELRAALAAQQWDIILSDYYLPSFNAEATLRTVREMGVDIPVIVVSGTVGEDVAVDTLRLGADDYLLKQKLTRLVPAVTRALSIAADRRRLSQVEDNIRRERSMLRSLIDSIPDLVFFKDQNFVFQGCNRAFENYLGMRESELVGKTDFDILSEQWAQYYRREDQALFASNRLQRTEEQIPSATGEVGTFDTIKAPFYGPDGKLLGLIGVSRNITDRKQIEKALRDNEQRLRQERDYLEAVIDSLPGVFYHFDQDLRLMRWNRRSEQLSGYQPHELQEMAALEFFADKDRPRVAERIRDVFENGQAQVEVDYLTKDGRSIPHLMTGTRFQHQGRAHLIGVGVDISERRLAEQRLNHLANHDDLTGLPNRNLIMERIAQAVVQARRTGRPLALLYLDLDRFKVINDGYGHPFGDEVLRAAGQRLAALVREGDTVARHGGDEFLILMPDLRSADDAYAVARKIVASLDQPLTVQERQVHLSGSVGVSVFPEDGDTAEALIGNADIAMYRAKSLGRNNFHFFTSELSQETQLRIDLETSLRGAAAAGQLAVHYQPKVDLDSGRISGCEALLRWTHPELGPVSPELFIPIAEESGLIVSIGDWVLRTACKQARDWLDAGLPPLRMAVNLSARQFLQQDVTAWVLRTLQETGLPPDLLELELTESLIAQDAEKAIATVDQLRDCGVRLSIDDFGTGYSSLNYLKRFHVDALKIDQSFVRNLLTTTEDATIVMSVISLAHSLDFKVIAEGVETSEQCEFLRLNRCDEIQGFYFSRPVPAASLEALVRSGTRLRVGPA